MVGSFGFNLDAAKLLVDEYRAFEDVAFGSGVAISLDKPYFDVVAVLPMVAFFIEFKSFSLSSFGVTSDVYLLV